MSFVNDHAPLVAWMQANKSWCTFAASLLDAIEQHGGLTDRQLEAIERTRAKAEAKAAAPALDVSALHTLFATAAAKGRKQLALYFGPYRVSPAPASGKNPGALYVKRKGEYLGKCQDGRLVVSDPAERAVIAAQLSGIRTLDDIAARGRETGVCCCCGAELSDPESIARGIGPVCLQKWS